MLLFTSVCAHVQRCKIKEKLIFIVSIKFLFQQFWRHLQGDMPKTLGVVCSKISSGQIASLKKIGVTLLLRTRFGWLEKEFCELCIGARVWYKFYCEHKRQICGRWAATKASNEGDDDSEKNDWDKGLVTVRRSWRTRDDPHTHGNRNSRTTRWFTFFFYS
jgi:hypothetical protein